MGSLPPRRMPAPPHALEDVFREHFDYVWRVARMLVGEAMADDVTQETFLIVRRRLPELHAVELRGWLYGVTRNVARNDLRSRRRYRRAIARLPDSPPTRPPDLDDALACREAARWLETFVDTLSFKLKETFVLRYLEGLTAREIAEAIDVPVPTVESRARLARRAFEAFMSERYAREERP